MRVTVVGCAGSFPGPDSPASCYLLEAEGFRLVIDLGNGALGALQRYAGLFSIDAICLSHLHADHCIDLAAYWVARQYAPDGSLVYRFETARNRGGRTRARNETVTLRFAGGVLSKICRTRS